MENEFYEKYKLWSEIYYYLLFEMEKLRDINPEIYEEVYNWTNHEEKKNGKYGELVILYELVHDLSCVLNNIRYKGGFDYYIKDK